jgi:hypothetical protein
MGAVSDDRGPEEVLVLMDFEGQHWAAEALENATRATELILGWVASMGTHRPSLDQEEAGDLDPTASRATQAVMRAATRVSSKQTKIIFGSNRNKPKQDLFRVCFGLFRETQNTKFRFVSVFRTYIETTETNRSVSNTNRNNPKFSEKCSLLNCLCGSSVSKQTEKNEENEKNPKKPEKP